MKVYKLTRSWESGFFQGSDIIGYYATKELAQKQAEILEPREEIRDYEYGIKPINVISSETKFQKKGKTHG